MPSANCPSAGITSIAGNDYFGLSADPRLAQALADGAKQFGISSSSSRSALGWTPLHVELEQSLARYFGVEDACVFASAYLGGAIYFQAARARFDTAYCDEYIHSSQLLGLRANGFTVHTFKHLDAADLKLKLAAHKGSPPLVATDGIYGISGELAPLAELHQLARDFGATLCVDDAHGVFTLGKSGGGSLEAVGLRSDSAVVMGSMSKALGCSGGFLLGSTEWVDQARRAAPSVGGSPLPPPLAAAALKAIEIVRDDPTLRERMWSNTRKLHAAAESNGVGVVSKQSPIVALILADEAQARRASEVLRTAGMLAPYFVYPSEPRRNILRCVGRACQNDELIERFRATLGKL